MYHAAFPTEAIVTPEKPPSIKPVALITSSGYSSVIALTPAVKMLLTAMPARISVVRESPARAASA